jgi:type IV pilus assembly protein PilC
MIEPALIVIMGVMLGFVIISVLGPVYDMLGKLDI